jgi:hypothetical protein
MNNGHNVLQWDQCNYISDLLIDGEQKVLSSVERRRRKEIEKRTG